MADDGRVYTDEEFAIVLRTAAELANRAERPGVSSSGLTLTEMKSAAAQAGLDPALVERAAQLLVTPRTLSPFERVIGGPLRHEHIARLPVALDEESAARLLSAVRIASPVRGTSEGHSSALGMSWDTGADGDVFSVVARPSEDGTSVSISVDRRGTFLLTGVVALIAFFFAFIVSGVLYKEASPALGISAAIVTVGGTLALARGFWASSTRKARERISAFMEVIGDALGSPSRKR